MIGKQLNSRPKKPFKKYCIRCGKLFRPETRYTKLCDKCYEKSRWRWGRRKFIIKNEN
jgi:uncharacterized C2H2 Zn-finger protein